LVSITFQLLDIGMIIFYIFSWSTVCWLI
jgi:hypothetical protein